MPRQIHYNAAEHIAPETAKDPYLRPAFSFGNRLRRLMWNLCWAVFFRFSPRPLFAWRSMLLRLFGAKTRTKLQVLSIVARMGAVESHLL